MAMVLDDNIWVLCLDSSYYLTQHSRATNACHILQANLLRTISNQFFCQINIVFNGMYRRISHTHRSLRCHASLFSPLDRRDNITRVIQTAEDTRNIHALRMLYLIHQLAYIRRNRIHTQCIKSAIQHMGFDTHLIKWFGKGTHCLVWILTIQ